MATEIATARTVLDAWQHMTAAERCDYLAALDDRGRRGVAQALADATAQRVDLIARSWVHFGYLTGPQASAALAAEL